MKKRRTTHYVDNKLLNSSMVEYIGKCREANKQGVEVPRIPPYVGECIMKIATHLASKPNFSNYTFKEEMISDGIENCLQYIQNFAPEKSENPFAYFTQIIYFAFLRRIQKEKKYLYTKYVATQVTELNNLVNDQQAHDTNDYNNKVRVSEWTNEQMQIFMEEFENVKRKAKKNLTSKKK